MGKVVISNSLIQFFLVFSSHPDIDIMTTVHIPNYVVICIWIVTGEFETVNGKANVNLLAVLFTTA